MAGTDPISSVSGVTQAAEAAGGGSQGGDSKVQEAFQQGIVKFMGSMLQSMESDITQAIQDNTSDPDAPA